MSLFPAYEETSTAKETSHSPQLQILEEKSQANWLTNSSFQPEIVPEPQMTISVSSDSSDCEFVTTIPESKECPTISLDSETQSSWKKSHSRKHKKSKKHSKSTKHKTKLNYEPVLENVYFDDKFRDKGNFKVDTLTSRVRPLYNLGTKALGSVVFEWKKKNTAKRYFSKPIDRQGTRKIEKPSSVIEKNKPQINEAPAERQDMNDSAAVKEDGKKLKIKEFNQRLAEEPRNVDLWLEYASFDYHEHEIENTHGGRDIETPKYQRMLAIIDKALETNSDSEKLLKMKLDLMSKLVPADQLLQQIEALISKDPGNIILWQALTAVMRSSVAMCTAPRVLKLHSKCFGTLHLWRRTCQELYDEHLLSMLYECLIFLRHAGLWEQMWEVIRLNLNLNLGISRDLQNLKGSIDEKKLIGMEEVILTSRLPLNQLWLRVELLRENSHWISISREQLELIGDSHRFITPEDVTEFVHPMLTRHSNLKMAIYVLLALKVPLLPSRHRTMEDLGMERNNWGFDSLESLLAMIYPCTGEMAGHKHRSLLSKGLLEGELTSGPQYLRYHPAQESYLDFIRDAFHIIAESLTPENKTSIYIWWLRFERMLVALQKDESVRMDKGFKRLKGILKEFLKKDENRNNLYYYREYALIERELGRLSNCVNILETAIQSKGNTVYGEEQTDLMSLYRTLMEVLLDARTWQKEFTTSHVLKVFCQMTNGESEGECLALIEQYLHDCYKMFVEDYELPPIEKFKDKLFLPNFNCDVIVCYVYLLYINNHEIADILQVFDKCLEKSRENPYLQEQFYENKINFLQLVCEKHEERTQTLRLCLDEALKNFPNNFYILSVFAGIESQSPHWSVSTQNGSNRLWPNIALCLAGRARLHSSVRANDSVAITAALNKLLHLHKRLSRIPQIRNCPLLWRLYMLLLREQHLCEKKGEEVYHESVAQCPWARCIYIDAAQVAPQFLTQIQDVIREKDLRMHVTPEELDILRGS